MPAEITGHSRFLLRLLRLLWLISSTPRPMHISSLHLYPVKSCRGLSITAGEVDDFGFVGDRRFMVVTEHEGMFLTQRMHPRMALIETALTKDALILSSPKHGNVSIP